MKKVKKVFAGIFLSFVIMVALGVISGLGYYFFVTHSVSLDTERIEKTKNANCLQIYDKNGQILCPSKENFVSLDNLSTNTKNAFICAEDKRFYVHHGLDYIRIGGAILSNIKSKSFNQGASTISQQLVKNSQLSNEKTINRKLKEVKLTKELERKYSKNEILEMYLNNIYFGNGCYGIENAAKYYFGKSAKDLDLAESALLAATINAPSVYDIKNSTNKAKERRNLVLDLMQKYNKIGKETCESAKAQEVKLNITSLSNDYYIFDEVIEEACTALNMTKNQLKNSDIEIYTYLDMDLQRQIDKTIKENYGDLPENPDSATIVIDNETNGILSITGKETTLKTPKQPGSVIKPVLVYAPAIEKNIISPATKLLDEKINISGYSPSNADNKFHGYVSARQALKNSYNVPAVKLLNELGVAEAQKFASKLGIKFSEKDNNLAIALGGFTEGTNLFDVANSYLAFANEGYYKKCKFIDKIAKKGSIIYKNDNLGQKVMKNSTAYLITNMLMDAATSGTAKRLKNLNWQIASKTGTVGLSGSNKNSDAYNVSYTSKHLVLSYFGGKVMPETINGATYPTMLTKDIMEILYSKQTPPDFAVPKSVVSKKISKSDYENNAILLTDDDKDCITEVFAKDNVPQTKKVTQNFKISAFNFEDKKPIISFNAVPEFSYQIVRTQKNEEEVLSSYNELDEPQIINFEDLSAIAGEIYAYHVAICDKNGVAIHKTNEVKLKAF